LFVSYQQLNLYMVVRTVYVLKDIILVIGGSKIICCDVVLITLKTFSLKSENVSSCVPLTEEGILFFFAHN
jgi:hypothetical protein